jgi:hypothetical protein
VIISPGHFFSLEKTINGQVYLDMLENFLFPQSEQNDLTNTIIFLQDSLPPHFSRHVMEVLIEAFVGRLIGKGGSILWTPRSTDLTPLGFVFWGYVKNYVYMDKIQDLNHLQARIREAAELVTRDMLPHVWQDWTYAGSRMMRM